VLQAAVRDVKAAERRTLSCYERGRSAHASGAASVDRSVVVGGPQSLWFDADISGSRDKEQS